MSIEYFVEGKILMQTEGDNTSFSKEHIVYNSEVISQKGELGIAYNTPKTIEEGNSLTTKIDVTLNIFFDGTYNNKNNTDARVLHDTNKGSSYQNEYSNIAKGYNAVDATADKQVKVYIEGIGTVDQKSDGTYSGGLGSGKRGIKAKVTKGCIQGAEAVAQKFSKKSISTLYVNVYGFSRGAAAARHFIHVASTPAKITKTNKLNYAVAPNEFETSEEDKKKYENQNILINDTNHPLFLKNGYFGACLLKKNLKIEKVKFNFVGLYDTVASFGVNHRGNWFTKNDSEQLTLNTVSQATFIFQIAAANEFRENFSLTNINASSTKGLQITLPGCHSDIGGGYVDMEEEKVLIYSSFNKALSEEYRQILINEGWYNDKQLVIDSVNITAGRSSYRTYRLWGTRTLSNNYDKIPLLYMTHYSKEFHVKYLEKVQIKNEINEVGLQSIFSQINKYVSACNTLRNNCINSGTNSTTYIDKLQALDYAQFYSNNDELKKLRNLYLHWSADLNAAFMGPRLSGVLTNEERTRTILNG